MNPILIIALVVLLAVVAAWAFGHYGTAGISAKVKAAQEVLAAAETKAGGAVTAVESALAHPIATVQNAEHAAVLKVAEEAGRLAAFLTDTSPEKAKQAALDAVVAAKNKALDDLIAKLQQARQQ
jgi:hypothetical protein